MRSPLFLDFLTKLTGIKNLIPEATPGGLSFIAPGGKLDLHSDFNMRKNLGLTRRVNCFIFLNDDWDDNYGGHLEMWSKDRKQCQARVAPLAGRLVVFTTSDYSWHGHPQPLTAPEGRLRRSLAFYFYTTGSRPVEDCYENNCDGKHGTIFVEPEGCDKCEDPACKGYEGNDDLVQTNLYGTE